MDEQQKKKQLELLRGASSVLRETLKSEGMPEYLLVGAGKRENDPNEGYDVFAFSEASAPALANMLLFVFQRASDDTVGAILNALLGHPAIMAKLAAYQSQMMAAHAERLRAQTAPVEQQQAPAVADEKKKPWLN